MLQCRRCCSGKLIALSKKSPQDNDVFRCQECGFLFSPSSVIPGESRDNAAPESHRSSGPSFLQEMTRQEGA